MSQQQHDATVFRQKEAQFILRGVSGTTFGKSFPLIGNMLIGREKSCDITIPSDEISRSHARIIARPDSILIEDLGSANGTYVNGHPIEKAVLKLGDDIRFDKIRFQVQSLNEVEEFLTEPARHSSHTPRPQSGSSKSLPKTLSIVGIITLLLALAAFYFIYYE